MKPIQKLCCSIMITLMASPFTVLAETSVLTGFIDGRESADFFQQDPFCGRDELPFAVADEVRVDNSGAYAIRKAHPELGMDVWVGMYSNGFNPTRPDDGAVPVINGTYQLEAGHDYQLVVGAECSFEEGFWTLVFHGPGAVTAPNHTAAFDTFNGGEIRVPDPPLQWNDQSLACGDPGSARAYDTSGPFKPFSGEYYFSDVSPGSNTQICLYVYEDGFDPQYPEQNLVARLAGEGSVFLEPDTYYEFVVQAYWADGSGGNQYFYLMTAQAPFRINPAISGNWFDPAKPGQGFFIDFLPENDEAFAGWFTYELAGVDTAGTRFGSGRHRWLTAFGRVAEDDPNALDLEIELTRGGRFLQSDPAVTQEPAGAMMISFTDCDSGVLHFEIEDPAQSGDIPISRVSNARSGQCRDAYRGPGLAGRIASWDY